MAFYYSVCEIILKFHVDFMIVMQLYQKFLIKHL